MLHRRHIIYLQARHLICGDIGGAYAAPNRPLDRPVLCCVLLLLLWPWPWFTSPPSPPSPEPRMQIINHDSATARAHARILRPTSGADRFSARTHRERVGTLTQMRISQFSFATEPRRAGARCSQQPFPAGRAQHGTALSDNNSVPRHKRCCPFGERGLEWGGG